MNWVSIDKDKCSECGLCVTRCMLVFREKDGEIRARANEETCNLCGHCVALCPTDAIVHHEMDMENFVPLADEPAYEAKDFFDFVRRRRSHRSFKEGPVAREHLETLVELCRYAPTGSNQQNFGVIVVEDKEKIRKFSDMTIDYFEQNLDKMEQATKESEASGKAIPEHLRPMYGMADTLKRLVRARELGFEVIFHKAPAVMIFHAPKGTSTPKDDCVIASTTVVMAAMTMGLETCYIGLFEFAANTYEPIVNELNLPPDHKVYSVLILGYPKFKYLKAVDRKPMRVRWE